MKIIITLIMLLIPGTVFSQNIDIDLLKAIHNPEPLPSDDFFRGVSNSYIYVAAGVPVTMAVAGLVRHDNEMLRNAAVVAAGSIASTGITYALKYTVKRERPFETWPEDITNKSGKSLEEDPSFPSGHTSTVFSTATALTLQYPKWYVIVPSYAYAGTVAYSRMHLGVHYPSDVLAGAAIGAGSAWLSHFVNGKINGGGNNQAVNPARPGYVPCNAVISCGE